MEKRLINNVFFESSANMNGIQNNSIDLVVTSPPYPMIAMWDEMFSESNPEIKKSFETGCYGKCFALMHDELEKVWKECFRVLKDGGFLCINIGNALRNVEGLFLEFGNVSEISVRCTKIGFVGLPSIIWRKPTNSPNKFMGSGMLPCGGYVTLEHESILVFRKGERRQFKTESEKRTRRESAMFWHERNVWFSDMWEIPGTGQKISGNNTSRTRSAAFPFEIPYRLINMFSVKGDIVLDPFLGTGTTVKAAIVLGRKGIGYESDISLKETIYANLNSDNLTVLNGKVIFQRITGQKEFAKTREMKHNHNSGEFQVMTSQETDIEFPVLEKVEVSDKGDELEIVSEYSEF